MNATADAQRRGTASKDRTLHSTGRVVSGAVGLAAFAVAVITGLAAHAPAPVVIVRAIVALMFGAVLGRLVGEALAHIAREFTSSYRESHPIPESEGTEREIMRQIGHNGGQA